MSATSTTVSRRLRRSCGSTPTPTRSSSMAASTMWLTPTPRAIATPTASARRTDACSTVVCPEGRSTMSATRSRPWSTPTTATSPSIACRWRTRLPMPGCRPSRICSRRSTTCPRRFATIFVTRRTCSGCRPTCGPATRSQIPKVSSSAPSGGTSPRTRAVRSESPPAPRRRWARMACSSPARSGSTRTTP